MIFFVMDAQSSSLFAVRPVFADADGVAPQSRSFLTEAAFSERLIEYLAMQGSTTFFLQAVSGMVVEVEVLQQHIERHPGNGDILRRLSRLYVRSERNVLLVAESTVQLSFFDARQRQRLIDGKEGIGKLLDPDNDGLLEKNDIEVMCVHAPPSLRTDQDWAISRHLALKFRSEYCADIREIVNNESLGHAQ